MKDNTMKSSFLLLSLCSLSVLLPVCAQDETTVEQPSAQTQSFDNLTFDDAVYLVSYMRFNILDWHCKEELSLIWDLLQEEQAAIIKSAEPDLSLVTAYYKEHEYCHPARLDESMRYHAVRDMFNIALYRFIYKTAFIQAYQGDPIAEEMLLFKNILTQNEYDKVHHWIRINRSKKDLVYLPHSIREKVIAFVKQLSFDELMTCLIWQSVCIQEKYNQDIFINGAPSETDILTLNQKVRSIFEQQDQPERKALTRFLYSDQELKNMYLNSKNFSVE